MKMFLNGFGDMFVGVPIFTTSKKNESTAVRLHALLQPFGLTAVFNSYVWGKKTRCDCYLHVKRYLISALFFQLCSLFIVLKYKSSVTAVILIEEDFISN